MIGASAGAGALTGIALSPTLFGPPSEVEGEIRESLVYTPWADVTTWWSPHVGQEIRVTDFGEWQGASAVWRGLFREGVWVRGTGYPVLVIRVKREDEFFRAPTDVTLPPTYSLYYDDPARDIRIVALFNRCTHLCCSSSWHIFTDPAPLRDYATYGADPPTWTQFGQDPVYCICHGAQYDPLLLVHDINPTNDVGFIGAQVVHGPATFAMPVIPLRAVNDVLYGGMADPRWYDFCERLPPGGM